MSRPGAQVIAASWPMLVVLTSPRLQQNAARSKTQTPSSFARLPGATTSARKLSTRRMELGRRYRPPPHLKRLHSNIIITIIIIIDDWADFISLQSGQVWPDELTLLDALQVFAF